MAYRVDIIVPVYNEKENFSKLYQHLQTLVHCDWQVCVVYDFPEDTTLQVAEPLSKTDPRVRLVQNTSRGALNAIKTGFFAAHADAVLVLMVDDSPESIEKIDQAVEIFYKKRAGIVAFSRYMKGGHAYGAPFLKSLLSRLAGVSLYYLIGVPTHDATNSTRLYRKSFLDRTTIESTKGFVLTIELTLKAYFAGERIEELPITWREREVGTSRFSVRKWLMAYLKWYFYALGRYYLPFMYADSRNTRQSL